MKRYLLFIVFCVASLAVYAQNTDERIEYYRSLEEDIELNLSPEQLAKIKRLNKEAGPKFEAIGLDNSLSGREKGQRKRELAVEQKKAIRNILTPEQYELWENKHGRINSGEGTKRVLSKNIDVKLDLLEEKYKNEERIIENNSGLTKDDKKARKHELKNRYQLQKRQLKDQKRTVKESDVLRH